MDEAEPARPGLKPGLLGLMAVAGGFSVSTIYYNQPLLSHFAEVFGGSAGAAGLVATASQVGYGLGLLLLLPLGDIVETRRLVVLLMSLCGAFLLLTAAAPSLVWLGVAHLLVGLTAINAQILIPFGADLAGRAARGRVVGVMMSGILAGLLLARTVAGFVSDHVGWRWLYVAAALGMAALALTLWRLLPAHPPASRQSYRALMQSLYALLRSQPGLRRGALISGLSFATFTAFWTALSFLLVDKFHLGASAAGLFGLVGLAGVAIAPIAGRLSDRRGSRFTVTIALAVSALSFLLMGAWITLPSLILGVILMDLGVQAIQVAEQARVLSLLPEAGSRLNTLYMVARFTGGAAGSALGITAWTLAHWPGVCLFALTLTTAAYLAHRRGGK